MSGNLLVRFDEGRVGRISMSPSLLLYQRIRRGISFQQGSLRAGFDLVGNLSAEFWPSEPLAKLKQEGHFLFCGGPLPA